MVLSLTTMCHLLQSGLYTNSKYGKRTMSRKSNNRKFRTKPIAEVAIEKVGMMLPIASGSEVKSKTVSCVPNASGQSAWYLLENGSRVCVNYKNWKPFHWVAPPIKTKTGTEVFYASSKDDTANPNLAVNKI